MEQNELIELLKDITGVVSGINYVIDGDTKGFGIGDWKEQLILANKLFGYKFSEKQITLISSFLSIVSHDNNK